MASSFFLSLRSLSEGSRSRTAAAFALPGIFGLAWCVWLCTAHVSLRVVSDGAELSTAAPGWIVRAEFSPGDAARISAGQRAVWRKAGQSRHATAVETRVLAASTAQGVTTVHLYPTVGQVEAGPGHLEVETVQGSPAVILWETLRRGDLM